MMQFVSTRSKDICASGTKAVADSIACDGGLFVPLSLPVLDEEFLSGLAGLSFGERLKRILALFFDDIDVGAVVDEALVAAGEDELSLVKTEDGVYMLDLAEGATGRAEDISLTVFARLLAACREREGYDKRFFVAYAGGAEIGRTLLNAFGGVEKAAAMAFYPHNEDALNVRGALDATGKRARAIGVKGGNIAEKLRGCMYSEGLAEKAAEAGFDIIRANELNVGRILPCVAIFFSAYCDLVDSREIEAGEEINFALPALDLTLATAGCYARLMGLPIRTIVIACNANKAAAELVCEGKVQAKRALYLTSAHELDVLFPANMERIAYELCGRDVEQISAAMERLFEGRDFEIEQDRDCVAFDLLQAGWADEDEMREAAFNAFDIDDSVLDPVTAVTMSVFNDYCCETEDDTPTVVAQCVNPYVVARDTLAAIGTRESDPVKAAAKLETLTALECPDCIYRLKHDFAMNEQGLIPETWMEEAIVAFLKEAAQEK